VVEDKQLCLNGALFCFVFANTYVKLYFFFSNYEIHVALITYDTFLLYRFVHTLIYMSLTIHIKQVYPYIN